jgi:hypothetical protein
LRFPGAAQHEAERSGALQTRDRYKHGAMKCRVYYDPGSAVHRCALHRIRETGVWASGNYRITFRVDGEDVKDADLEDYHGK